MEENLSSFVPCLIYYYKQRDFNQALEYLNKIEKCNQNFVSFFVDKMEEDEYEISGYYQVGASSEVYMIMQDISFSFEFIPDIEVLLFIK